MGAAGIASDAIAGRAVSAGYSSIAGVDQETLELGISANTVATPLAQLGAGTVGSIVSGVGFAKLGLDGVTVLYGYFFGCH